MIQNASQPKQLVIVSGKGGTGKTSFAASFAQLNSAAQIKTVMVDADVDASNLELLLDPYKTQYEDFYAGEKARIDPELCQACGQCAEVCRFSAVKILNGQPDRQEHKIYQIDSLACEGCAACTLVCDYDAIQMDKQKAGVWSFSQTRFGPFFHANLFPGQENSGKLVTLVKQQARLHALENDYALILVDGPPGIGCPVISAFAGADLALIVTEPTVSGLHDLDRILKTIRHFKLSAAVCINKADLHTEGSQDILKYAQQEDLIVVGQIPYDPIFMEAVVCGMPVTNFKVNSPAVDAINEVWKKTMNVLQVDGSHAN